MLFDHFEKDPENYIFDNEEVVYLCPMICIVSYLSMDCHKRYHQGQEIIHSQHEL